MNEYPKVLVLGEGLLGSEIVKQTGWDCLSDKRDKTFDVVWNFHGVCVTIDDYDPDIIINCVGNTDTYNEDRSKHWEVNYQFVVNLADFCDSRDIKLVQVSTDYVYANSRKGSGVLKETDVPVHQETWYGYTKLVSDAYVQLMNNYLLVRGSHKPKPFPYEKAFGNVWGNFDYVDEIASQIIELIREDRDGVWNIGTEFKTIHDLAVQTKPGIESIHSVKPKLPSIEMDLTKFNERNK